VQVTLRDTDEHRLLARLGTLLAQFPAATATEAGQGVPEGWCQRHSVEMTRSKDGQSFYHKLGQKPGGTAVWCRGR
jgi:hypothetical protein